MKNLLVILDDLTKSDDFLRYTADMAEDLDYNLHISYILNPVNYPVGQGTSIMPAQAMAENIEAEKKYAKDKIEEKLISLRKNLSSDIIIDYSVETGAPNIVIDQLVSDKMVDMVVLKGINESGFWNLYSDSTNMEIILQVKCPVWIIPEGVKYNKYDKIVYATDYNEADIRILKELIDFTKTFSPEIIAFHITSSIDFEEKAMKHGFREMLIKKTGYEKISINTLIDKENGNLGEIVNDFALGKNAKLIVLLKENKTFFEKLFKSSSTKKILKEAQLPVLIYHERK